MRKISLLLALWLVADFLKSCDTRTASVDELSAFIQHQVDSLHEAEQLPGILVGTWANDKKNYFTAGFADPETRAAFDSLTIFEIGSITKTFTAFVLEMLLSEKQISDSASIIKYLPDSVQTNKALSQISFLELLNHTSGLPRLPDNMDLMSNFMSPYDDYTPTQLFSYLKTCVPQPDGRSNYSNLGVGLAGILAQRISGSSYEELLHHYIFSRWGITQHRDTTIQDLVNKAQGYYGSSKAPYWFADALAPAGGLKCSASELLSYLQYMSAPTDSSRQVIDKLLEKTATVAPGMNICRAWHTRELADTPVIYWHNGGTFGFSTFAAFSRREKKAVVIVINQFNKAQVSDRLGFAIMKKMLSK